MTQETNMHELITYDFENEVSLTPYISLWDRGDGYGEISLFNSIVAYVEGQNLSNPEDYYHYDEELGQYVEDYFEYIPTSCFPGNFTTSNEIFKSLEKMQVQSQEHLTALLYSISPSLLPPKPKGSISDIFSQKEKFLVTKDFNTDIVINGKDLDINIVQNFNYFSNSFYHFFLDYPEVSIKFINHCYLNGNVNFLYGINETYFLNIVLSQDNKIIFSPVSKKVQMKNVRYLSFNDENISLVFTNILEKLKVSKDFAKIELELNKNIDSFIENDKNQFITEIINLNFNDFIYQLSKSSFFVLQRNLKNKDFHTVSVLLERNLIQKASKEIQPFKISTVDFLSLLINSMFD